MKDVFISYAHEDREAARELSGFLEGGGLSVWWDPQLRAGEDFAKIIDQTLQHVRCVIVLWSSHSVDSRWVRAEANEGLRLQKLVPVMLDDSTPPLIFRALHTVRLEKSGLHAESAQLQKLIDDIRALIGMVAAPHQAAVPVSPERPGSGRLLVGASIALVAALGLGWSGLAAYVLDVLTGFVGAAAPVFSPLTVEITVALVATVAALIGAFYLHTHEIIPYAVYASAFVVASVGYAWVERWLDPPADHLFGRVVAQEWTGLSVSAVDASGRDTALQAVPVSSVDGSFGMRLSPVFANRPRFVILRRQGCRGEREGIEWLVWRQRKDVLVEFDCN